MQQIRVKQRNGQDLEIRAEEILEYHLGGKVGMQLTKALGGVRDLCMAYTPGVAVPVRAIDADPARVNRYTARANLVAVVTDGSAILGLGDLGPAASIPVMEGKAALFKAFGDVDAWPVPLDRCRMGGRNKGPTDPERVIDCVCAMAPMYGGINLEDIAAPACFEIEDRLQRQLDVPVFHDDQWGTAVITLAGVMNACLLSGRSMDSLRVVVNGAGAAGIRIAEMLKAAGAPEVVLCDSRGVVRADRADLSAKKREHAVNVKAATVEEALAGADVFIGVSVGDCIRPESIRAMAGYPAIFAMANPDPEIRPERVRSAMGGRPYIMATGRSDFPNQINNVLGFPFLFRGALDAGAETISMDMKIAAARALAEVAQRPMAAGENTDLYDAEELRFGPECIIPKPFDTRLFVEIPCAVAGAAPVDCGHDPAAYRAALQARNRERLSRMGWQTSC